ncbi:Threonine/homoserine efflux transporter RhtA [Agrococcus baldri]|uniref:Threonine/homoserine efflux transporter RhtA n=1 Tax=Agrococcus baldri TaxID=153730 RepID=A0AA94HKW1_9MICO|nr:DMT family transporter [Agrococcus baldri]SFS02547.1 Threonine/homoserine efflux transporter RhtA [Agrococcus baldri]
MPSRRPVGLALALASAASFALSGIFASALLDGGWSAGAVTLVRIAGGALVLLVPTLWMLRGRWDAVLRSWREVVVLGVLAVAVCQLAFFSAVAYIDPSLALLIEFLGPVLLVFYSWARTRRAPAGLTFAGAAVALLGLGLISGIGGEALHPVGVLLALGAAVGNAGYWASASKADSELPPVALAGLGLIVGAVVLGLASATGLLPFVATAAPVVLAGSTMPWWLAMGMLILLATSLSYVLGILGARRLGATLASFVGYSEPMFGILWTALLLAILPTGMQWVGAAAIIAGVLLVRFGQVRRPRPTRGPAIVEGIPSP